MRFQDILKFSVDLILPERVSSAIRDRAALPDAKQAQDVGIESKQTTGHPWAHSIIKDLDQSEFGGPSFGPQTVEIMESVLNAIQAEAGGSLSDEALRRIASSILKAAAEGERDASRLKAQATALAFPEVNPAAKD